MNHKTQEVRTYENGTIEWYFNGKRHRTDGPAVIHPDGYQVWYLNGKLHRTDGPAVIYSSGYQAWYQDGKRHRTDGPAVIDSDGGQAWYLNGKPHRTDGPAVVYSDGTKEWYLDNERFTEEEYLLRIQTPEQLLLKEIAKLLTAYEGEYNISIGAYIELPSDMTPYEFREMSFHKREGYGVRLLRPF